MNRESIMKKLDIAKKEVEIETDYLKGMLLYERIKVLYEILIESYVDSIKDNIIDVTNEKAVDILYTDDMGFKYNKK